MQVQLWNDNHEDYIETFRGETIKVPAKGFVVMDRSKAVGFKGSFSGGDPITGEMKVKMLRIVEDEEQKKLRLKQPTDEAKICNACGNKFLSDRELKVHIEVHHADQILEDHDEEPRRGRPKSK